MRNVFQKHGIKKQQIFYFLSVESIKCKHFLTTSYNLRWPMIVDMINTRLSYNLEGCQLRYYSVSKLILKYRREQGRQLTAEEEQTLNYSYVVID